MLRDAAHDSSSELGDEKRMSERMDQQEKEPRSQRENRKKKEAPPPPPKGWTFKDFIENFGALCRGGILILVTLLIAHAFGCL